MNSCPYCLADLSELTLTQHENSESCPICGRVLITSPQMRLSAPEQSGIQNLISNFFKNTWFLIFNPTSFFETNAAALSASGGVSMALTFAVLIQWIASFFNFIWRAIAGILVENRVGDLFSISKDVLSPSFQNSLGIKVGTNLDQIQTQTTQILFGAGSVVITPFTTLLKIFLSTVFIHLAVKIFFKEASDRPLRFSTTLKILCYASAPWVLCVIPGLGMLAAYILSFIAMVIGLKTVYKSTSTRAFIAASFPELLFFTIVFIILVLVVVFAVSFLKSFF